MKYQPHQYQQYAAEFIEQHPTAALLLDMGLGKTVITLTALDELLYNRFEISRVLVIAPLRVASQTWPAEIAKWEHLHLLDCAVAVGNEKERRAALDAGAAITIINRENVAWLVETIGQANWPYDMVVIDELSSFKNHKAIRFKALSRVRPKICRIVGLTGTPTPNGLMDLWAQYRLLDQGLRLGKFVGQYRDRYFTPDKRNGQIIFTYKPKPTAEQQIYNAIGDITVSMRALDHLIMPELVSTEYRVELDASERQRYQTMAHDLVLELDGGEVTAGNAAVLSSKLAQMANGAIYGDDGAVNFVHDRKLDALEDIIESANGKPLLIAYWFQHDLQRITKRLSELKVPHAKLDTAASINKWNRGDLPVALIHPASAGHGLNLQAGGNHLVWFGLTWSLELYQQTNARLWRQGQTAGTVVIQHIVTAGTIDTQILQALSRKDQTQAALIQAVKANLTTTAKEALK